jgi:hypothetical protein
LFLCIFEIKLFFKSLIITIVENSVEKMVTLTGCRWLTPIILATQEAEIRRITVLSQPRQTVCEILSQKLPNPGKD